MACCDGRLDECCQICSVLTRKRSEVIYVNRDRTVNRSIMEAKMTHGAAQVVAATNHKLKLIFDGLMSCYNFKSYEDVLTQGC